jgi:hypothetical protein
MLPRLTGFYVPCFLLSDHGSGTLYGHVLWHVGSIHHTFFHRVRTARETESEPPGYQTESRHIGAGLGLRPTKRGRDPSTRHSGSVPPHAQEAQRLCTSSPADTTMRPHISLLVISSSETKPPPNVRNFITFKKM